MHRRWWRGEGQGGEAEDVTLPLHEGQDAVSECHCTSPSMLSSVVALAYRVDYVCGCVCCPSCCGLLWRRLICGAAACACLLVQVAAAFHFCSAHGINNPEQVVTLGTSLIETAGDR